MWLKCALYHLDNGLSAPMCGTESTGGPLTDLLGHAVLHELGGHEQTGCVNAGVEGCIDHAEQVVLPVFENHQSLTRCRHVAEALLEGPTGIPHNGEPFISDLFRVF